MKREHEPDNGSRVKGRYGSLGCLINDGFYFLFVEGT